MNLFQQLPDDIVLLVGKRMIKQHYGITVWKSRLPLIAICQRWRHLLLGQVWSQIFVRCGNFRNRFERVSEEKMAAIDASQIIVTNADITPTDAFNCPAHLLIELYYMKSPFFSLKRAIDILEAQHSVWTSVSSLDINLYKGLYCPRDGPEIPETISITALAQQIKRIFPNVTKLEDNNTTSKVNDHRLFENLIREYELQLANCILLGRKTVKASFAHLTHLDIDIMDKQITVYPESLIELRLHELDVNYNWDSFRTKAGITFSNLKTLYLSYRHDSAPVSTDPSVQPMLEFPVLENLSYFNSTQSVPFFNNAHLPAKLKQLIIRGNYNTFHYISEIKLPQTDALTIFYAPDNQDMSAGAVIRQILAKNPSKHLGMAYALGSAGFNVLDLACPKLNRIRVNAPSNFQSIIETINKHPHLTSLAFRNIVPGDYSSLAGSSTRYYAGVCQVPAA
ncbi:hypothetical protein BX667DRAFT_525111 [Coemansia mojavensis]|nr:hypothetical protein BX667DRAFT_525111 [Coemansia mojavensis]